MVNYNDRIYTSTTIVQFSFLKLRSIQNITRYYIHDDVCSRFIYSTVNFMKKADIQHNPPLINSKVMFFSCKIVKNVNEYRI